jgi:hypothetical protein
MTFKVDKMTVDDIFVDMLGVDEKPFSSSISFQFFVLENSSNFVTLIYIFNSVSMKKS